MALNRKVSEDDWFDVGDASAIKSARRAAASPPPPDSSARLGNPPPPLTQKDETTPVVSEVPLVAHEEASPEEDTEVTPPVSTSARTSLLVLEEDEESSPSPVDKSSPTTVTVPTVAEEQKVSPIPESVIVSPTSDVTPATEIPEVDETVIADDTSVTQVKESMPVVEPTPTPSKEAVATNAPSQIKSQEPKPEPVATPGPSVPPTITSNAATVLSEALSYVPPKVLAILLGVWIGFKDSSNMMQFIKYCDRDSSILRTFIHCTVLNTIFIISLFTIVDLVAPLQPTGAFAVVWETLFSLLWVVPMYAITQVLGITWYEEIYRKCVQVRASERNRSTQPTREVSFIGVSELVMKFLVTLVFGLLAAVIAVVLPRNFIAICGINLPVGALVSFAMSCWLHAFYCFDYRFLDQGRVDRSGQSADSAPKLIPAKLSFLITLFERKWPYYLGYGASHIMIRTFMEWIELPLFARMAVCSALFTVNVVTTVEASVRWEGDATVGRLPIFTPFYKKLSEWVAAANSNRARTAAERKSAVKGPVDTQPKQQ